MSKDSISSHTQPPAPTGSNRMVPRYPFEARCKIRIERPGQALETEGWARDLSESGLGAFVAAPLSLGEPATLQIPLPGGDELVIPSIVARKDGTQYGFRFMALSSRQRNMIHRAIVGKKAIAFNAASV